MRKFDKWVASLELTAINGDCGYISTFGELIDHGGRNEFFRVVTKRQGKQVTSRAVYHAPEYNRTTKKWDCSPWTNGNEKALDSKTIVFFGFTY